MELTEILPADAPVEGDKNGWHMRLRRTITGTFSNGEPINFELWQLWFKDEIRSNVWDKPTIQKLLEERDGGDVVHE